MFDRQLVCLAFSRALAKTGKRIAARMAMMRPLKKAHSAGLDAR
jgi:hypothetical protein